MQFKNLLWPLLAAVPIFAQAQNLVVNGSFEDPSINAMSFKFFDGITGWSTSNQIEIRRNWIGTAEDGKNFAELDTTGSNSNSSTWQDIATDIGATYTFSFWFSNRPYQSDGDHSDVPASTSGLDWAFGGTTGSAPSQPKITDEKNHWTLFTQDIVATSTTTRVMFTATGKADGLGSSLDNISVALLSPAPVPEPTSFSLLAAGLCAVGFVARRRRR